MSDNDSHLLISTFVTCFSPFLDGVKLEEADMSCKMSGCEHDYTSNTYRMMVELWSKTSKLSDHFIIVKVDPATGFPKICGLR